MPDNPLLNFPTLPRFADIAPAHVGEAVDVVLAAGADADAQVAGETSPPNWENTILPLETADENISRVWNQVEHMHAVMSSPDWRAAHRDNLPKVAAFYAARGQNAGVYRRWKTLADSAAFAGLSAARQKIVADGLRDFELSGIALPAAPRAQFRQNSERLAALGAKFEENLLAATNDFAIDVDAKDEKLLGDMPADLRAAAKQTAEAAGGSGFRFTLQSPSFSAFMQYATARKKREQLHRAYYARASEFGGAALDNSPLVKEILSLRQEQAEMLGFPSYAALALQTRMAPSVAAGVDFLRDLVRRARPHAEREVAELRRFAVKKLGIMELSAWDVAYVAEQLRRRTFDFSAAELRPYLREDKILDGLFACVQKLFGVSAIPAAAPVWRDDVRYVELVGADGEVVGGLYLDLYARDTKRGGAWMADALSRCSRAGKLQKPVAHIACNFAKPADGAALLDWDEVVTLFHECGHALHHILTEMSDYSASGISGVEWDAVELPSQWLENFVWDWRVLQPMTAHAENGEPMPRPLFDKVRAARLFLSGMRLVRQLEFALFDFSLHNGENKTAAETLAEVRRETALLPMAADNRFYCGFSHIFAGGYAAGYYSYLWAEVLAADIFAQFASSGDILDGELGGRFRREILAVGGGRPAMESFVAMRGREPAIEPLLAHYGLAG